MPRRRGTTVAGVVLDVADVGALGGPADRWDVADGEHGAAVTVDELARVLPGRCRWRAWRGGRRSTCNKTREKLQLGEFRGGAPE